MEYIKKQDDWMPGCAEPEKRMEKFFLLSIAPVLTGVKPAALVSFRHCCKEAWQRRSAELCRMTRLKVWKLDVEQETFSVLVYHPGRLKKQLQAAGAKKVLGRYGYPERSDLKTQLNCLRNRFSFCGFPHEIGVFLGYPPADVEGFIRHNGQYYLCCRYWKVYRNEQEAHSMFRSIDEARALAFRLIMAQIPISTALQVLILYQKRRKTL